MAFADASEDTNEVCKAVEFYKLCNQRVVCGLHTIHGRDNAGKTVIGFKGYAFSSSAFHNQIRRIAQGTKIYSINVKNFSECHIGIPSKAEQRKIAGFLRLLDERIAAQRALIGEMGRLKSAMIETHYVKCHKHKVRFADLGEPFNVGNISKSELSGNGTPCILYGELFTTYGAVISKVVSRTSKSEGMTLSKKGDLIFPSSTTVDSVSLISPSAISIDGVALGGDMFGIHINPIFDSQYLSYYFNYIGGQKLAKYAKGSTIIHLHWDDIENVLLELPNLKEQKNIVLLLNCLEEKTGIESEYLDVLLLQKQYLLRKMFI